MIFIEGNVSCFEEIVYLNGWISKEDVMAVYEVLHLFTDQYNRYQYSDGCLPEIRYYHEVSTDEGYGDLPLDRPDLFFTEETPIHTSSSV